MRSRHRCWPAAAIAILALLAGACGPRDVGPRAAADGSVRPVGGGRWVDLTHAFDSATVYWPTERGFTLEQGRNGPTARGYYYAANRFETAEHGGTHLDAPRHFSADGQTADAIPPERLVGEAAVVDVAAKCAADRDYEITIDDLLAWETHHGRPLGDVILLLRTGWADHWGDRARYLGTDRTGPEAVSDLHFPGLAPEAAQWLVAHRRVKAVGIDTASIDHGPSTHFGSHVALCGANVPVFENVAALGLVPATGAFVAALPMKIAGGSGGPLRIVAQLPVGNAGGGDAGAVATPVAPAEPAAPADAAKHVEPAGTAGRPDPIRDMQVEAEKAGRADWGHWGDKPAKYVAWSQHSNRLIPVYTFGIGLDAVSGANSVYRDESRLEALYGRLPDHTLNPDAAYFDQTDVARLQRTAAAAGKKVIVLVVFDGMDWHTTRTAAIAATGTVAYDSGRGTGFAFQDYLGAPTDFGWFVTSPANDGTKVDVDAQALKNPGGEKPGGYDPALGGSTPWDPRADIRYLMGRDRERPHAVTDSAASATSLCTGRKTYNDAINVGPDGEELVPVARELQRLGWAVGAVTSVPVSHATPACAYANNVSRDDYQDIARDLLGLPSIAHRGEPLPGLDVLIGGGAGVTATEEKDQGRNFEPGNKYVADSTLATIDAAVGGGYVVARRTAGRRGAEVLAATAREAAATKSRLFGFFGTAEGHLPFRTADGDFNPTSTPPDEESGRLRKKYGGAIRYTPADLVENPTLAEMVPAALDVLAARSERVWLMVEAGEVDWASHANNIDTTIGAVESGDTAVKAVFDWIERHGGWDTAAVIVTSDHGHAFVLEDPTAFTAR